METATKPTVMDFRDKAYAMAAVALEDAYSRAIDPETPTKTKLDFVELCTKLADLHPKAQQQQVATTGFRISINLGDPSATTKATNRVIDVTPEPELGARHLPENDDLMIPENYAVYVE